MYLTVYKRIGIYCIITHALNLPIGERGLCVTMHREEGVTTTTNTSLGREAREWIRGRTVRTTRNASLSTCIRALCGLL